MQKVKWVQSQVPQGSLHRKGRSLGSLLSRCPGRIAAAKVGTSKVVPKPYTKRETWQDS